MQKTKPILAATCFSKDKALGLKTNSKKVPKMYQKLEKINKKHEKVNLVYIHAKRNCLQHEGSFEHDLVEHFARNHYYLQNYRKRQKIRTHENDMV